MRDDFELHNTSSRELEIVWDFGGGDYKFSPLEYCAEEKSDKDQTSILINVSCILSTGQ